MACSVLSADIMGVCDYENLVGVETNVVVINKADILESGIQKNQANQFIINSLTLVPGKKGFMLKGVKKTNAVTSESVANQFGADRHKHMFTGVVPYYSGNAVALDALSSSDSGFVVVYMSATKQVADMEAFKVLGLRQGLKVSVKYSTAESGGAAVLSFESTEGYEEPAMGYFFQDTNYETSLGIFNNKFEA